MHTSMEEFLYREPGRRLLDDSNANQRRGLNMQNPAEGQFYQASLIGR